MSLVAVIEGGEVRNVAARPEGRSRPARMWALPLWAHAAVLAAVLAALTPFMTLAGSFTSDEGAYALQVEALRDGGWEYEYPAAEYDPEGRHFPLVLTDTDDGRYYPYAKHPAYPLLLRAATGVAGTVLGLHLIALAGALATAVAAWLLAAEVDGRLSRPAFWLAATSPVLANGFVIWAHAPSAALAGLALVAAVRVVRHGPRWGALAALTALLSAGVLLRSEALLLAGAVVAALAWFLRARLGTARAAAIAAAVAAPVLAATWLEGRWISSIMGDGEGGVAIRGDRSSFLAGRFKGAWHELVSGLVFGDTVSFLLLMVGLGAVAGFGWAALRRERSSWSQDVVFACAVAVVVYGARLVLSPRDPVTGLFGAWPVALLGLLLVPWRRAPRAIRMVGAAGGLFGLAVLATQYPQGGGLEWGGRFFSPFIAPVAVLAVYGLTTAIERARPASDGATRLAAGALAAVALVTAAAGVVTVGGLRASEYDLSAAVARHPADVTVTTVGSLPRSSWSFGSITWMRAEDEELGDLLARLRAAGVERVAVLTAAGTPVADLSPYPRFETFAEAPVVQRGGQLVVLSG